MTCHARIFTNRDTVPHTNAPALQRIVVLDSDSLEIRMMISPKEASRKLFGGTLFSSDRDVGPPIILRSETGTLRVGINEAPFAAADLPDDEDVDRESLSIKHRSIQGSWKYRTIASGSPRDNNE
jgi:hypothetical protein